MIDKRVKERLADRLKKLGASNDISDVAAQAVADLLDNKNAMMEMTFRLTILKLYAGTKQLATLDRILAAACEESARLLAEDAAKEKK